MPGSERRVARIPSTPAAARALDVVYNFGPSRQGYGQRPGVHVKDARCPLEQSERPLTLNVSARELHPAPPNKLLIPHSLAHSSLHSTFNNSHTLLCLILPAVLSPSLSASRPLLYRGRQLHFRRACVR